MKLIELFEDGGVGKIVPGVNTTVDVGPDEISIQARKWGFDVNRNGYPPLIYNKKVWSWKKKKHSKK